MFGLKAKLIGLAVVVAVIGVLAWQVKYWHGAYVVAKQAFVVEQLAHEVTAKSFSSYKLNAEAQVARTQKALDDLGHKYNKARVKSNELSKKLAKVDFTEQVQRFPAWIGRNINRATAVKLRNIEDLSADFSRGSSADNQETP
ncbi:hypothetical protein LCGC14_0504430 [marine sediment metagenome]|uniref:Uncharacterized protein n=1 Tax=marine sediment metagenome TaxID=412755 RepID=A0A0F9VBH3_9ZZZZ